MQYSFIFTGVTVCLTPDSSFGLQTQLRGMNFSTQFVRWVKLCSIILAYFLRLKGLFDPAKYYTSTRSERVVWHTDADPVSVDAGYLCVL